MAKCYSIEALRLRLFHQSFFVILRANQAWISSIWVLLSGCAKLLSIITAQLIFYYENSFFSLCVNFTQKSLSSSLVAVLNRLVSTVIDKHQLSYITYMVKSPSWEANWFAASQEIPRISWNPKVHYRTHKRPRPVSILGKPNPGHIPTSHLLEIHPNLIHPSTPRSPQWSPSLRFPSLNIDWGE